MKTKLFVSDLLGKKIEITDYEGALKQVEIYANFKGDLKFSPAVSAEEYWKDILKQLKEMALKNR